jgi:hypothetical protein
MSEIEIPRDFLTATENELERTFSADVELELGLVDVATGVLVSVLTAVGPRTITGSLDEDDEPSFTPEMAQAVTMSAMTLIGARGVRVIRAARAVLARGFEPEARALDRILVELMAHRRVILDDPTGREALGWMQRERRWGISRKVAALGDAEVYGNLSGDSHGDPFPLSRMRNLDENMIDLRPTRTSATRASLLLHAGFARDQAVLVSEMSGAVALKEVEELDAAMGEGWARLQDEAQEGARERAEEPK